MDIEAANNNCLTLGSLFDGLGVWLISAKNNGIKPLWCSEIEKFPIEVTKYHHPEVVHHGDVTKIDGSKIQPVDIITSGSPCQSWSTAGSRTGFEGQSGLFSETTRIIKEMYDATEGQYPKFMCLENVVGIFSANKGYDFKRVLEEITETDVPMPRSGRWAASGMVRSKRCDVVWRTLDAQYWGVPQRRKRVFLIADYRTITERRSEVYFISESLSGNTEEGEGTGQGITETSSECFAIAGNIIGRSTGNGGNGKGFQEGISYTLTATDQHAVCDVAGFNCFASKKQGLSYNEKISPTLTACKEMGVVYSFDSASSNSMKSKNPHSGCRVVDVAKTLDTSYPDPSKNQGGMAVLSYDMTHPCDVIRENKDGTVHTLTHRMGTGGNQVPLVQNIVGALCADIKKGVNNQMVNQDQLIVMANGQANAEITVDKCPTLTCLHEAPILPQNCVRRLTPLECERLQGMPDNYTLIPHKSCSDSARYKAIGNSMSVPCSDYVMSVVKQMAEGNVVYKE